MSEEKTSPAPEQVEEGLIGLVMTRAQLGILLQLVNAGVPESVKTLKDIDLVTDALEPLKTALSRKT